MQSSPMCYNMSMNKILIRFYDVSELFRDDERLMAAAIKQHLIIRESKCSIYKDLLNCKYGKWIDRLEEVSHLATDIWMNDRQRAMDNGDDKVFLNGDIKQIESMCNEIEENEWK